MFKKFCVTLLVGSISTITFASTFAEKFIPNYPLKKFPDTRAAKSLKSMTPDNHPDFSGQWVGSCDNNPSEIRTHIIKQYPFYIQIDDLTKPLNTLEKTATIDNENYTDENSKLYWNPEGTELIFSNDYIDHRIKGGSSTHHEEINFRLENNQLIIAISYQQIFIGTPNIGNMTCVYHKKDMEDVK